MPFLILKIATKTFYGRTFPYFRTRALSSWVVSGRRPNLSANIFCVWRKSLYMAASRVPTTALRAIEPKSRFLKGGIDSSSICSICLKTGRYWSMTNSSDILKLTGNRLQGTFVHCCSIYSSRVSGSDGTYRRQFREFFIAQMAFCCIGQNITKLFLAEKYFDKFSFYPFLFSWFLF